MRALLLQRVRRTMLFAAAMLLAWAGVPLLGAAQPAAAKPAAREEIAISLGMKLVLIPAGEFSMGNPESVDEVAKTYPYYGGDLGRDIADEYPRHRVRITRPFYLGQHEVTVGQFREFTKATGYQTEPETDGEGGWGYNPENGKCEGRKPQFNWRKPGFEQTDSHPVLNVTWNDAAAFCQWLGRKEQGKYRLPTEAEWEYACRAGTTTRYFSGDDPKTLAAVANTFDPAGKAEFGHVDELSVPKGHGFTVPVGSFKPNPWGLYDVHGNVWEWCSDWHGSDYYANSPQSDPTGPADGEVRVRRGGAWNSFTIFARSSFRNWNSPGTRCVNLGFRVACDK